MFKYVVVRDEFGGIEVPLIFPETINHSTVQKFNQDHTSVSAGFCGVNKEGRWEAWGQSLTLRLKSRPEIDGKILTEAFGRIA